MKFSGAALDTVSCISYNLVYLEGFRRISKLFEGNFRQSVKLCYHLLQSD